VSHVHAQLAHVASALSRVVHMGTHGDTCRTHAGVMNTTGVLCPWCGPLQVAEVGGWSVVPFNLSRRGRQYVTPPTPPPNPPSPPRPISKTAASVCLTLVCAAPGVCVCVLIMVMHIQRQ
jgi:hypothetical protein